MSYYVKVEGSFIVPIENIAPLRDLLLEEKESEPRMPSCIKERTEFCEEIRSFLQEIGLFFSIYKNEKNPDCVEFNVDDSFNCGKDIFTNLMYKISRFCAPAHVPEFYFRGDDGDIWKLVFDKEKNEVVELAGSELYEVDTSCGRLKAVSYDDGCAKGIQIMLDDKIITAIDVLNKNDGVPGEVRALIYANKDLDEPTECFHIEI